MTNCVDVNVGYKMARHSVGPDKVIVRVVCSSVRLSVYHARISPKLSEIDVWLLGSSNRKPDVRFRHFGCFRIGTSLAQTEMGRLG